LSDEWVTRVNVAAVSSDKSKLESALAAADFVANIAANAPFADHRLALKLAESFTVVMPSSFVLVGEVSAGEVILDLFRAA